MENLPDDGKPATESVAVTDTQQVSLFGRHQWVPYVLPFLVFMLAGQLEPRPPAASPPDEGTANETAEVTSTSEQDTAEAGGFIQYKWYPLAYALRIGLTLAAIAVAWPLLTGTPMKTEN